MKIFERHARDIEGSEQKLNLVIPISRGDEEAIRFLQK